MSRLARPAARLATGSRTVVRRLAARAAAWCARGRRHDLTGWRAALGILLRLALLAGGAYLLARIVRALPALMVLLTAGWLVAAWRSGRAPEPAAAGAPVETPEEASPASDREAVRTLLLEAMGSADKVHLRTALTYLQAMGQWQDRTVTDMRLRLDRLDIPVDRRVKVAGVPTWGVRRRDLETPSPGAAQETSTAPSTAA
ncbi:hypothetical protein ACIGZH_01745 [Streptomyces sp. NPDC058319]|uniref:hypothetical protein n=1 Tax=unclassified Streptomyces TaxID=2593676 RepID=UPI0036EBD3FC